MSIGEWAWFACVLAVDGVRAPSTDIRQREDAHKFYTNKHITRKHAKNNKQTTLHKKAFSQSLQKQNASHRWMLRGQDCSGTQTSFISNCPRSRWRSSSLVEWESDGWWEKKEGSHIRKGAEMDERQWDRGRRRGEGGLSNRMGKREREECRVKIHTRILFPRSNNTFDNVLL